MNLKKFKRQFSAGKRANHARAHMMASYMVALRLRNSAYESTAYQNFGMAQIFLDLSNHHKRRAERISKVLYGE